MQHTKTIILSTHIIEEISGMLSDVLIIKDKKLIINESTEILLKSAYCVSGAQNNIDKFIQGKNCINTEQMASFKSATIFEQLNDADKHLAQSLELEITKVELQKLFVLIDSVFAIFRFFGFLTLLN